MEIELDAEAIDHVARAIQAADDDTSWDYKEMARAAIRAWLDYQRQSNVAGQG